jgi:hypothetical protein
VRESGNRNCSQLTEGVYFADYGLLLLPGRGSCSRTYLIQFPNVQNRTEMADTEGTIGKRTQRRCSFQKPAFPSAISGTHFPVPHLASPNIRFQVVCTIELSLLRFRPTIAISSDTGTTTDKEGGLDDKPDHIPGELCSGGSAAANGESTT